MSASLERVEIENFTSIQRVRLELTSDVTVLVGANGAGKSNVIQAFEMLGRIVDRQLQERVLAVGGFSSVLNARAADESIRLAAWGPGEYVGLTNGYEASLRHAGQDEAMLVEKVMFWDEQYSQPLARDLGPARESRLASVAEDPTSRARAIASYVLPLIAGCRVFHFHDTSSDAPVKRRVEIADNLSLANDARNIAAVLHRLKSDDRQAYDRIVRAVRTVAPFFDDFALVPDGHDQLVLRWREKGVDTVFSANRFSDGTLRFVCLATLLLLPDRPSTVVLDEPELGLHPFAVIQLAALLRAAATDGRKVVIATQSVNLLSEFDVSEIGVVERALDGTTVTRPDPEALGTWLEQYSLGEIWEKNLLGGRPRPDAVPR